VQWHRARALAERWDEELETIEEEFRRTIRSYDVMSAVWTELGKTQVAGGYRAYAMQKASAFCKMGNIGRGLFRAAGGTWPAEGTSLFEHIAQLRKQRNRYVLGICFLTITYHPIFSVLLD
jgi:hypothetical protein